MWPAYAYAGNRPLHSTDPTGLFERVDYSVCANWYLALDLARSRAGCDNSAPDANQCACRDSFPPGCDICKFLDDVSWPRVDFQKDRYAGQWLPDEILTIWYPLCWGVENVEELAATMLHESVHACEKIPGVDRRKTDEWKAYGTERRCGFPANRFPEPYKSWYK
jgi:hypothetical protein